MKTTEPIIWQGRNYSSWAELAHWAPKGVDSDVLRKRIARGMTIDEAMSLPVRQHTGAEYRRYPYRGQMLTASELLELAHRGLTIRQLRVRLSSGWPTELALSTPPGGRLRYGASAACTGKRQLKAIVDPTAREKVARAFVRWVLAYEGDPELERLDDSAFRFARPLYEWHLKFAPDGLLYVTSVFRKTGALSGPERVYQPRERRNGSGIGFTLKAQQKEEE